MQITIKDLINAIKSSTREKETLVRSSCYYAEKGDFETTTFNYIDPELLIKCLEGLDE